MAYPLAQALWATQVFDAPPNFLDFLRFLCVADGARAREVMGYRPRYDIKSTILDFLRRSIDRFLRADGWFRLALLLHRG